MNLERIEWMALLLMALVLIVLAGFGLGVLLALIFF